MNRRLPLFAAALALASCHTAPEKPQLADGWIRLPAVTGRPGAAYFTLHGGRIDDTLVAVSSPAAIRAELHESVKIGGQGGAVTMKMLREVPVPADAKVVFAPGAKHIMLFDVDPKLHAGDSTTLKADFASGRSSVARVKVIAAGDPSPY